DADTGKELARLPLPPQIAWTYAVAWHPDGRRLAAGCNRTIYLWDAETRAEVMPPWAGHSVDGVQVAFNHAGDRLGRRDWSKQSRVWDGATGRTIVTMPGKFGLQFGPDDRLLGHEVSGSKVRLWEVADGRELRVFRRRGAASLEQIYSPVVHPDGRLLAASY